jgi:pimeloyl-ACP methyl ester carboxylesterase
MFIKYVFHLCHDMSIYFIAKFSNGMKEYFSLYVLIFVTTLSAHAGSWTTTIRPRQDDNFHIASFRLWIDDSHSMRPVRGLLIVAPGWNGDGYRLADDVRWQSLARELHFGIVAVTFKSDLKITPPYHAVDRGSGKAFLRALRVLAANSNHSEIATIPWLAWGHSAGGQFAYGLACVFPERTLAFAAIKGGYYETKFDKRARTIPGLWVIGERDAPFRAQNIITIFEPQRFHGALWCVAWEKDSGHEEGRSRSLVVAFFRDTIRLRLPATEKPILLVPESAGWFGKRENRQIAPIANSVLSTSDAATTVWLPGKASAEEWVKLAQAKMR